MPKLSWKNVGIHDSHKYLGWQGFPASPLNNMNRTVNVHAVPAAQGLCYTVVLMPDILAGTLDAKSMLLAPKHQTKEVKNSATISP